LISATVPAGERLFFTIPAQLLAGVDWHPVAPQTSNAKIIGRKILKLGIVAPPLEIGFLVGRSLFGGA
jgi:hypothetical protein